MKALYILCNNKELDTVGYNVTNYLLDNYTLEKESYKLDTCTVYKLNIDENTYFFMITEDLVMHNTAYYLDFLNEYFNDVEAAVHVNYHTGGTAPDPVLTVHHVGDIISGTYLPYNPKYATNLLVNMDRLRKENDLVNFSCESETTHYSGIVSNIDPKLLLDYNVNNIDLEIGSVEASFNDPIAVKVICEAMFEIFNDTPEQRLNVLYLGGAHFEATYTNAILDKEYPIYLTHQLCGLWLMQVPEDEIETNIRELLNKSTIKYDAIVFHEKVKKLKPLLTTIGEDLDIKVFKYNALKNIATSDLGKLY